MSENFSLDSSENNAYFCIGFNSKRYENKEISYSISHLMVIICFRKADGVLYVGTQPKG